MRASVYRKLYYDSEATPVQGGLRCRSSQMACRTRLAPVIACPWDGVVCDDPPEAACFCLGWAGPTSKVRRPLRARPGLGGHCRPVEVRLRSNATETSGCPFGGYAPRRPGGKCPDAMRWPPQEASATCRAQLVRGNPPSPGHLLRYAHDPVGQLFPELKRFMKFR
jgi:hypothetical protein